MELKDWANVIAVLLSPLFAVQVTVWLNDRATDRKDRLARKRHIFHTLMATRGSLGGNGQLSHEHVQALNTIDIEFHGDPKAKAILTKWKAYLDQLNTPPTTTDEAGWALWGSRREQLLVELLSALGTYLGYDFDETHLRRTSYFPQGYGDIEMEMSHSPSAIVL
jgi:hypothetical protein